MKRKKEYRVYDLRWQRVLPNCELFVETNKFQQRGVPAWSCFSSGDGDLRHITAISSRMHHKRGEVVFYWISIKQKTLKLQQRQMMKYEIFNNCIKEKVKLGENWNLTKPVRID